jgi:histidinol-phosphate phosphatase family protein
MPHSTGLRLLFLSSIPRWGGGERWMVDAAAGLRERGHDVLLAARPGARLLDRAQAAGVPARAVFMAGDLDPRALFAVRRLLSQHRPHAVFVNLDKELRYVCWTTAVGRRPLLFQRRGSDFPLKDGRLQRYTYGRVSRLVTNSATLARKHLSPAWLPANAVSVIPNGVDTSRAPGTRDRAALRRTLRLPRQRQIIVHVGELEPRKGQATTLRALAEIRRRKGGERRGMPTLALIGTGGEEPHLRDLCHELGVQDHVMWIGFRTNVDDYLAAADLLVLPSQNEGVPWTILEAMAAGVPVIASAVSGIPEVIRDGENGLLVPPEDPVALADAVQRVLGDSALATQLGQHGFEAVRTEFDAGSMLDDLESLIYLQLLRQRWRGRTPESMPALFTDRDDTLVYDMADKRDVSTMRLVPGAGRALRWLRDAGLPVIVVSNQSGVALGEHSEADVLAANVHLRELLTREGADVDAVYFCPHHPDFDPPCDCRKPEPGLLLRAAREHSLDLAASLMVGDRDRDLEAGRQAGTRVVGFVAHGVESRLPADIRKHERWTAVVCDFLRGLYTGERAASTEMSPAIALARAGAGEPPPAPTPAAPLADIDAIRATLPGHAIGAPSGDANAEAAASDGSGSPAEKPERSRRRPTRSE